MSENYRENDGSEQFERRTSMLRLFLLLFQSQNFSQGLQHFFQIPKPGFKKSERYNTKYRNDISYRSAAARSTTNAPVYIPTIPSTPYVPTVPTITPPTRKRVSTAFAV